MYEKNQHSSEFKMKILKRVRELTNQGKHKEATELFNNYFLSEHKGGENEN